jgi:hypothetical protein
LPSEMDLWYSSPDVHGQIDYYLPGSKGLLTTLTHLEFIFLILWVSTTDTRCILRFMHCYENSSTIHIVFRLSIDVTSALQKHVIVFIVYWFSFLTLTVQFTLPARCALLAKMIIFGINKVP